MSRRLVRGQARMIVSHEIAWKKTKQQPSSTHNIAQTTASRTRTSAAYRVCYCSGLPSQRAERFLSAMQGAQSYHTMDRSASPFARASSGSPSTSAQNNIPWSLILLKEWVWSVSKDHAATQKLEVSPRQPGEAVLLSTNEVYA